MISYCACSFLLAQTWFLDLMVTHAEALHENHGSLATSNQSDHHPYNGSPGNFSNNTTVGPNVAKAAFQHYNEGDGAKWIPFMTSIVCTVATLIWGYYNWIQRSIILEDSSKSSPHQIKQIDSYKGPRTEDFENTPYTHSGVINVQGSHIPWTCSTPDYKRQDCSYVVSPYAHFIGYASDEVEKYLDTRFKRFLGHTFLSMLGKLCALLRLDDCIYFNNYLLSTNLWPNHIDWSKRQVQEINQELLSKQNIQSSHPKVIVWRSIDELSQPKLFETLCKMESCILVPARVVNWIDYSVDMEKCLKKRDMKRDLKLFKQKCGYDVLAQKPTDNQKTAIYETLRIMQSNADELLSLELAQKLVNLYDQLYLDKYSNRNPQFNAPGIVRMVQNGFLVLEVLQMRGQPDHPIAVAGWWHVDDVSTAPFVGYDISCGDKDLYRLTMALCFQVSKYTGMLRQHLSGGANAFKRNRGAKTVVEYIAVFLQHDNVPLYQKTGWNILSSVVGRVVTTDRAA